MIKTEVNLLERLQILWVTQSVAKKDAGVKPHTHPYYHMFYVKSGTCSFAADNAVWSMHAGQIFLVPRETVHSYINNSNAPTELLEIKFSLPQAAMDSHLLSQGVLVSDNKLAGMLFEQVLKEYSDLAGKADESAASYVIAIVNLLTEATRYEKKRHFRYIDASSYSQLSQRIICYLEDHYAQELSLDALSEAMGYNKSYLCVAFKRDTQSTILDCLNMIRIRRAAELIVYSDHSLTQVADMCGFSSDSHFNRVFVKYVGITPGQCRRAYPGNLLISPSKNDAPPPESRSDRFIYSVLAQKRIIPNAKETQQQSNEDK